MFNKKFIATYLTYASIAAIAFCIPVLFYLRSPEFIDTWLLFLGNALFLIVLSIFVLVFNKKKHENASTQNMNAAGHIVTFMGVVISAILTFILLMLLVPDLFDAGPSDKIVENAPAQNQGFKNDGLVLMLFMNAIIGNFAAGSFAAIILPYAAKRNQTKDKRSQVLNN